MNHNTPYYLAFQKLGIGAQTIRRLLSFFPSIETLWHSSNKQLSETGISKKFIETFCFSRQSISPTEYTDDIVRPDCTIICLEDLAYPRFLLETSSPPLVLFARGNISLLQTAMLTVVGTRTATKYGLEATRRIIEPLAEQSITIVSGLAFGIDAAAHTAAIKVRGKTIAVLGSSVQVITPRGNAYLGTMILEKEGLIISEYPPNTPVQKHHFPQRNRILAGLSPATLVIEAGPTSGALITASMALEEGREIFAVPGPITQDSSLGTNTLLANGASVAMSAQDLHKILGLDIRPPVHNNMQIDVPSEIEMQLLSLLREPRHVDELVELSTLDPSAVNASLSVLELRGQVRDLGGMRYQRS